MALEPDADGCKVRFVKQFRMRAGIRQAVSRLVYDDQLVQFGPARGLGLPWPLEQRRSCATRTVSATGNVRVLLPIGTTIGHPLRT